MCGEYYVCIWNSIDREYHTIAYSSRIQFKLLSENNVTVNFDDKYTKV